MENSAIPLSRLAAQGLAAPSGSPAEALARLLAVQGQDYPGAKWTLGLRCGVCADADVERAIERGQIVRAWALRGTLHFVAAADLRWLLALLGPRVIAAGARRYRELELDGETLRRSADILSTALDGGKRLDRPALFRILDENGVSTAGQRGVHLLQYASLLGLICQGVTARNQPTFYRIDDVLPHTGQKSEEEALAELARRYFATRGPAALPDFIWWSGLPVAQARRALEAVRGRLHAETLDGQVYWRSPHTAPGPERFPYVLLLPGFDEYLLSYKDRRALMDVAALRSLTPKNGMLPATLVIDGRVTGVWKRTLKEDVVAVTITPFRDLSAGETLALEQAVGRYAAFLGRTPQISCTPA